MSTFSEKLRILRKNKEWTQAQLADSLSVSESTVQKWEVDKNAPPVSEIKRLAEVFYLPVTALVDDAITIPEFYCLHSYNHFLSVRKQFSPKTYAGLKHYANLHRFLNKAGEPYSAIYVGRDERLSCERDHEQGMIDYWNQG